MKAHAFHYEAADDLSQALTLLAHHGEEAKVLAGGQSLVPLMNMRLATPSVVVDIGRIAELSGHQPGDDHGRSRWGALVRHADVEDGLVPDPTRGLLRRVAAGIGYRAVRNAGTIGGSLAHADASAEWCTVLPGLDATVTVASLRGTREVPCRELVTGYFTTILEPDELIISIDIPSLDGAWRAGYRKFARKAGEFAESIVLALLQTGADGVVSVARLWLGAAGAAPVHLVNAEAALVGSRWDEASRAAVYSEVVAAARAAIDEGDSEYRAHLHGVMVGRAIDDAAAVREGDR